MRIDRVHCFFEQSGTFKDEFAKFGIVGYDYDIKNDFGKTDFRIDLFQQIVEAYLGHRSVFDRFGSDDLIIAFFPCIRFEAEFTMHILGNAYQYKGLDLEHKLLNSMRFLDEVKDMYDLITKLVIVCLRKHLRLIIENPYRGNAHFLTRYWPIKPSIVDMDRSMFGDDFKKPTQYWFINCIPENNITFGNLFEKRKDLKKVQHCSVVERSMISPTYAYNFIRDFIITQ